MQSRFDFNNEGNKIRRGIKIEESSGRNNSKAKSSKKNNEESKTKKGTLIFPKRNIISFRIIFYAFIVLIAAYLFYNGYKYLNSKNISTYQVKEGALSEQNSYTGLILREEELYYAKSSGYYNFYLKEGEKASHNDLVYSIDGSGKIKEMMTKEPRRSESVEQLVLRRR